jgi:hypothetical protein
VAWVVRAPVLLPNELGWFYELLSLKLVATEVAPTTPR